MAKNTGLAHTFAAAADKQRVRAVLSVFIIALAAALVVVGRAAGLAMAVTAGVVLLLYRRTAVKQFGGITGDLAGWFLQRAELFMLAALAAVQLLAAQPWAAQLTEGGWL